MIQFQHETADDTHYFAGSFHKEMALGLLIIIIDPHMIPHNELPYAFVCPICDFDNYT